MTKKIFLILLTSTLIAISGCGNVVLAQDASTSSGNINPRFIAIRKVVDNYVEHLDTAVDRSDRLLDKLQARMIKAKATGMDMTQADILMKDARAKISAAKTVLNNIEKDKLTATKKTDWVSIKNDFKQVKDDLKAVRLDAENILTLLKNSSSSTSSSSETK